MKRGEILLYTYRIKQKEEVKNKGSSTLQYCDRIFKILSGLNMFICAYACIHTFGCILKVLIFFGVSKYLSLTYKNHFISVRVVRLAINKNSLIQCTAVNSVTQMSAY